MHVMPRDTRNLLSTPEKQEKPEKQENLLICYHSLFFFSFANTRWLFEHSYFHPSEQADPCAHTTFDELSSDIMQIYCHPTVKPDNPLICHLIVTTADLTDDDGHISEMQQHNTQQSQPPPLRQVSTCP